METLKEMVGGVVLIVLGCVILLVGLSTFEYGSPTSLEGLLAIALGVTFIWAPFYKG